jgi:hypothetical protein
MYPVLCKIIISINYDYVIIGLRLYITHRLLLYADDVNVLGGSVHTAKENGEVLVVASEEIGLEVNADKTKYSGTSVHERPCSRTNFPSKTRLG